MSAACPEEDALSRLHDGLLLEPEAEELRAHLLSCEPCRRRKQALAQMDVAISGLLKEERGERKRKERRRRMRWAMAVAAGVVLGTVIAVSVRLSEQAQSKSAAVSPSPAALRVSSPSPPVSP